MKQEKIVLYFSGGLSRSASWSATWHMGLQALARSGLQALAWSGRLYYKRETPLRGRHNPHLLAQRLRVDCGDRCTGRREGGPPGEGGVASEGARRSV